MLRRLASTSRLMVLLAMIFASPLGHHLVMAAETGHDHSAASAEHDHHAAQQQSCQGDDGCLNGHEACCVLGQCMLALAPGLSADLPAASRLVAVGAPVLNLVGAHLHPPLRPPV